MNKTKIEWCDYTWNPVTGCYHNCEYCYARRIANRFSKDSGIPNGGVHILEKKQYEEPEPGYTGNPAYDPYPFSFEPTFHKYRLNDPTKLKKPSKIFVSSMGDLFGEWVPDEWIESVLRACRKAPQHTYMFLTKNPWGYDRLQAYFTRKDWLGVTIDGSGTGDDNFHDYKGKRRAMDYVAPVVNRFISIEPLINPIDPKIIEGMDWVIVGAQTGPGAKKPKKEWVENIISYARAYDIPIFLKDNLEWPEKIQDWPEGVER